MDNRVMRIFLTVLLCFVAALAACDRRPAGKDAPVDHNRMDHSKMDHSRMGHAMESSPGAASAPYALQFLDTMTAHHQGAIDMAQLADTRAGRTEVKTLAKGIIDEQRKEIAQMNEWRSRWFGGAAPAVNMDFPGMSDGMKGMDMANLDRLKANDFDLEFIRQMIPHHAGALAMARDLKAQDTYAELKSLSDAIIKSQTAEIDQMRSWQTAWNK